MLYMVVFVVNNPDDVSLVLDVWEEAGARGATILESTGMGRIKGYWQRDDLPLMPSLSDLLESVEIRHRTIFSVVDGESMVDEMIAKTTAAVGDLDEENSGFLFVIPVTRALGLGRGKHRGT